MRRITGSIVFRAAIVLFSVFCIFSIVRLQFEKNELESQLEDENIRLEEKQQDCEELERLIDIEYDEEYVKKVAKEELGYREPAEIIYYSGN